ncbi:MAG: gliding motility-associated ABC transporter ATP-binding subunit GldA [Lentimicrobiaceae bacterium]|nr:gliding motility-associated ABC transporter ATP-binding subunit GldA [Lentimicrobiaceae bacterium]
MSIEVNHIYKNYGAQLALNDVSFRIQPGEIVGLLGPNGAGKSTMMKIITCFIPATIGTVSVYGYDTREHSLEVRRKIGYLPENNPLYIDMYIREYLEFIAGLHHLGKATPGRVDEMMEITGLNPEKGKKIRALSKGFRQRVGLAQALIHDPEVLILDEPTSGLDPNQLVDIRQLITRIGKEKTVILSTHIMQEVEAMCSRAIIINKGKIVADDSTARLVTRKGEVSIVTVEFDQMIDQALLKQVKGVKNVKNTGTNTWTLESDAQTDIRQDLFKLAVTHNLSVLSMQKAANRLEDIFQQLTQKENSHP